MHSLNHIRSVSYRLGRYELREESLETLLNSAIWGQAGSGRQDKAMKEGFKILIIVPILKNNNNNLSGADESTLGIDGQINLSEDDSSEFQNANQNSATVFPFLADSPFKRKIIKEWQSKMDPLRWIPTACAVCGQAYKKDQVKVNDLPMNKLQLLQNNALPQHVLLQSYNFNAYNKAILHPKGLTNLNFKSPMNVCASCQTALSKGVQPLDSLANFQYYGLARLPPDVNSAFQKSSIFDLMLISRARCSRLNHLFVKKSKQSNVWRKSSSFSKVQPG